MGTINSKYAPLIEELKHEKLYSASQIAHKFSDHPLVKDRVGSFRATLNRSLRAQRVGGEFKGTWEPVSWVKGQGGESPQFFGLHWKYAFGLSGQSQQAFEDEITDLRQSALRTDPEIEVTVSLEDRNSSTAGIEPKPTLATRKRSKFFFIPALAMVLSLSSAGLGFYFSPTIRDAWEQQGLSGAKEAISQADEGRETLQQKFQRGFVLMRSGDLASAERIAREFMLLDGNGAKGRGNYLMAYCRYFSKDPETALLYVDEAISHYEATGDMFNDRKLAYLLRVRFLLLLGRYEMAHQSLKLATDIETDNYASHVFYWQGRVAFFRGNFTEAVENGEEALRLFELTEDFNSAAECLNDLAIYHEMAGDRDRAWSFYLKGRAKAVRFADPEIDLSSLLALYAILVETNSEKGHIRQEILYRDSTGFAEVLLFVVEKHKEEL